MTELYLHIGTPKTGSTAIQSFCRRNCKLLEQQDICFPYFEAEYDEVGTRRNAYWLDHYLEDAVLTDTCLQGLYTALDRFSKVILSDEGLWNTNAGKPGFWEFFLDRLAGRDVDLKVIVYLRRQDLYVYSKWAQYIKADCRDGTLKTCTFQEYLEQGLYGRETVDYESRLDVIERVAGRDHMIVRVFEPDRFHGEEKTIFSDFMDAVGARLLPEYSYPKSPKNISFKGSVLEAKRLLNQYQEFYSLQSCIRPCLEKVQVEMEQENVLADHEVFPIDQRVAFMQKYAEGNAAVARKYLGREDGILFDQKMQDSSAFGQDYTTEELIEVCGRVIVKLCEENHSLYERKDEVRASNQKYSEKLRVTKEKLREEKESNKQLRAQIAEQERQIRSLQRELDSSILKLAAKKVFKKRS